MKSEKKPMANKKVNLTAALKKYFGFDKFKGDQEAIVQNVLDGRNTFVLMPTGGGKSLCYVIIDGRNGDCHLSVDCPDEKPGGCHQFDE